MPRPPFPDTLEQFLCGVAGAVKGAPGLRGEALPFTASVRRGTIRIRGKGGGTLPRVSAASGIFANRYNIPMTAAQAETANVFSLVAFPPSLPKTRVWGPGLEKQAFIGPPGQLNLTLHWGCGYIYVGTASGLTDQRYYASGYGRFNTVDPYDGSAHANNPASWNRFAYVGGDPQR
jgi:hypothetical protein